jgi:hypothetical protein
VNASPHINILIVTMFDDDPSEMLRAIRTVGSGEVIFSSAIATRLMGFFNTMRRPNYPKFFLN